MGGRDCNTLSRCWSGFLLPAAQEKPILQAGPKPNSSPVMLPLRSSLSWTSFTFPVQPLRTPSSPLPGRGQATRCPLLPPRGAIHHSCSAHRKLQAAGPRRLTQRRLREAAMHVASRGPPPPTRFPPRAPGPTTGPPRWPWPPEGKAPPSAQDPSKVPMEGGSRRPRPGAREEQRTPGRSSRVDRTGPSPVSSQANSQSQGRPTAGLSR